MMYSTLKIVLKKRGLNISINKGDIAMFKQTGTP